MVKFSYYDPPVSNIYPSKEVDIHDVIDLIRSNKLEHLTTEYRSISNKEAKSEFKKKMFPGITFSGTFSKRTDKDLKEASNLICIDIDDLQDWEVLFYSMVLRSINNVVLFFVSPTGNGIKIIFRVNGNKFCSKENYDATVNFLLKHTPVKSGYIDQSCSNLSRLCFVCHDPHCYVNPLVSDGALEHIPMIDTAQYLQAKKEKDEEGQRSMDEKLTEEIEETSIFENPYLDITDLDYNNKDSNANFHKLFKLTTAKYGEYLQGNRHNFIQRFASLCNHFGMSKAFLQKNCNHYLRNHPSTIDQADPFDFDKELIRIIDDVYARYKEQFSSWKNGVSEEEYETPALPDFIYENLPEFIKKACTKFQVGRERDVFLLGTLTVLSNCFPIVRGRYGGRFYGPFLFLLVCAPASAGKGVLDWCRIYGKEISKRLKQQYEDELQRYEVELQEWNKEKQGPRPKKPQRSMFFIPADISASGILSVMNANKDYGLIFETETDTLTNIMKNDWANFSDVLRKSFQQEPVTQFRKTNDEHIDIERAVLSMLMSGTPSQLPNLLSSVDNGFFSRLIFYDFKHKIEWKDVFHEREEEKNDFFEQQSNILANIISPLFSLLKIENRPNIDFSFTPDQKIRFNKWFSQKQAQLHFLYGDDIIASVRRIAIVFFRLAMILTILRKLEDLGSNRFLFHLERSIICSDLDYNISEQMIDCLLHHTLKVFREIRKRKKNRYDTPNKEIYFKALSDEFDFKEARRVGELLGFSIKTIESWLNLFIKEGRIEKPERNVYQKK